MTPARQVLVVIAVVTAVRAVLSLQLELTSVESYLWLCSRRPALGYYDYPAMVAWMGWLSTTLFGDGVLGFRMLTILGSAATIGFTFLAARRLYDGETGARAAFLVALAPMLFAYSAEATPDAPLLLFWSAAVWALAHAFSGDSPRWWYLAGLSLGLAMDSKYHAVFLGFGVLGFLVFSPEHRFWLRRKEPWIGVGLALLAFSPTILWNARNDWQSFLYQGVNRFRESGFQPSQFWRFASSQLLLLTPVLAVGAWWAGFRPLVRWRSADWRERFLAALGTPLLLFFVFVILSRPVRGHWTVPGYLTALILLAAALPRLRPGVRLSVRISGLVLFAGILLLPAGVAFVPVAQRSGWTALGARVAGRKPEFIVCNEYHLASQMGFVLRTTDAWDLTPAGKPSKNFPNWWDPKPYLGKNAVVVYEKKRYPRDLDRLRACFERVGPAEEVEVARVGGSERYMVMSAWNYRGTTSTEAREPSTDD